MASTHIARVTADGVSNRRIAPSIYLTCSTAANTVHKTITNNPVWTSADLFDGLTIFVRFEHENTATNPDLNIDSTGAKPIYKNNNASPGTTSATSWRANTVLGLTYDTTIESTGCWLVHGSIEDGIPLELSVTRANIGSASLGTAIAADDITAYSAGTAASLTTTDYTVPNVTSVGTAPSLTVTTVTCDDITDWTANTPTTPTSATVSNGVLTITPGTTGSAASLSYTARSVGSASNWSAGSVPTLGTAFSIKGVNKFTANTPTSVTYTARSIPNVSVTSTSVVTDVTSDQGAAQ